MWLVIAQWLQNSSRRLTCPIRTANEDRFQILARPCSFMVGSCSSTLKV